MAKQTEDFDLHVIEAFNESTNLPFHGQLDAVNAFESREAPTAGWRRCGVGEVVRHGRMVLCSWLSKSTLRHGVHPQRQGHHPESPVDPVGFCDKQRRDDQQRVVEKPKAPCDLSLTLVGDDDRRIAERAGVDMGAKDIAGLGVRVPLHRLVICKDWGLDWPRDGLERRACCGTTGASVAGVFSQRRGLPLMIRPALGHRGAGRLGRVGGANALGVQVQERCCAGGVFALCGVGKRGFRTRLSRR